MNAIVHDPPNPHCPKDRGSDAVKLAEGQFRMTYGWFSPHQWDYHSHEH